MCLNQERRALAEEALEDPNDLELQEEVAARLGVVNDAYTTYALSAGVRMEGERSTGVRKYWAFSASFVCCRP
jgi:hypothetical protein